MRKIKLKALAVALITTFLLGSNVVMAGDVALASKTKTLDVGVCYGPGDSIYVPVETYIIHDDTPNRGNMSLPKGSYLLGDEFAWTGVYSQWYLTLDGDYKFFLGYGTATGQEHPIGIRCNGGEGTSSSPYTFELIYAEDYAIIPGTVIYLGESFTLNSSAWFFVDDYFSASSSSSKLSLQAGEYVYRDPEWSSEYGQWYMDLYNLSAGVTYETCYGDGYATENEEPVALMVTEGNGTSASPFFLELVTPMYRLYNPNSGEHFYTSDPAERSNLISLGWNDEGIGWYAPSHSDTPVYRLYNQYGGEHHYTTSLAERDNLVSLGWSDEGIGWYSDDQERVPLYRQYNPNEFANNHNYTTSRAENDWLISLGWRAEDIGWYGVGYEF